ncbi:MAG: phosphoribosylformylglycinamidine synthase subunit PurL [Candidatus Altiarchaeota archaeon]|nr:phosphoribosylformylglycinamidine synthase subunit PurL [Candidatus Altiarchaeota archaeon]
MYKKILENPPVYEIDILGADDQRLGKISREKSLGLSLDELRRIKDYFAKEGRNPRDVELEAFAQSWSEHCCYKSSKPILKKTVFCIKAPQNICVIAEDAGVVDFDKDHAYVVALESHNHPSALDPYGGAATGIGGILRDVICMGSQPVALIDPIFFGPLDYDEKKLPKGVKHPRFLFHGVVDGIGSYGNRVGIPTVAGMTYFDESYVGNCLVNVGCIGIIEKKKVAHSRVGGPGDVYIYAGGKTGRDGIHGVTFASAELHEASEERDRPAVQLGYAIMKEPLMHAVLEVNEKSLATGIKDFGGGGLSCVTSEMAHAAGLGGWIELDKIPLKEEGLSPWEIWVSESQERMMLSVKPENVDKVLEIFDFWDVPAMAVGRAENTKRMRVTYNGFEVLNVDLDFLIAGVQYQRPYRFVERPQEDAVFDMPDLLEAGLKLLGMPNIASKESVIRRYDHEVRAGTIIKPMQGIVNSQTHGDAAIVKPLEGSNRGLAITADVNPAFCELDPYWGAASAVEEVVRNLVAVHAVPHSLADCLNFGNPEKPECFGDFIKASEGLYHTAQEFGVPYVSGNVSLYNESALGPVAPTPTLLGVGIIRDVRTAVTSDLKKQGNAIYLVGDTGNELGGSQYLKLLGVKGGIAPRVDARKTKKNAESLLKAMDKKLIKSCHDPSEGGLFAAISEMCFGGKLGVDIDLTSSGKLRTDIKLFSESNGRWLVEVEKRNAASFEKLVKARKIGVVTKEKRLRITDGKLRLDYSTDDLRKAWRCGVEEEK